MKGYVYVLSNESMPGVLKIGRSIHGGQSRVTAFNKSTHTLTPFVLEFELLVDDCVAVELAVHQEFSDRRFDKKEFFKVDLPDVENAIYHFQYEKTPVKKSRSNEERADYGRCLCGCERDQYGVCPDCYDAHNRQSIPDYSAELIDKLRLEVISLKNTIHNMVACTPRARAVGTGETLNSIDIVWLKRLIAHYGASLDADKSIFLPLDHPDLQQYQRSAFKLAHFEAIDITQKDGHWYYRINCDSQGWVDQHNMKKGYEDD